MNKKWLVDLVTPLAVWMSKYPIPFFRILVKKTIFEQFVGGEDLQESQVAIDKLWSGRVLTVLDYGAEGKTAEEDLDTAEQQFLEAVTFAASNESVPVVSIKISALSQNRLLELSQSAQPLREEDQALLKRVRERVDSICNQAYQMGVKIFIDAEESWIQDPIDEMVDGMMERYNHGEVVVYQTFQMYRNDRLDFLKSSYQRSMDLGYKLGAKIVRGAYLEKERLRAEEEGYPSPIHNTKAATDQDYLSALEFCISRYDQIASCAATHNIQSCLYQAQLIGERDLPRNHPHLNFCQLYGMSDQITYNLAANGYNVAKYVVYGEVRELVPYLSRRASENTAVQGEYGREYKLIREEMNRRGF